MVEEIFGPILPIVTYETEAEAMSKMSTVCSQPLAMYIFSEDNAFVERALGASTSGSVVVNSCNFEQNVNHHLPVSRTVKGRLGLVGLPSSLPSLPLTSNDSLAAPARAGLACSTASGALTSSATFARSCTRTRGS